MSTKETMTPKERWQAVLSHRTPDRMPMDYWATDEMTAKMIAHLSCFTRTEMLQKLHVDFVVHVSPVYTGPALKAHTDEFGCRYRDISYGTGTYPEVVHFPLAGCKSIAEIEKNYTWPNPDWWDYRGIPQAIEGREEYPIQGGGSEPFLIYKNLRGQEQAMVDLAENPDMVEYCLEKLFNLAYINTQRILEQIPGKVLLCYVAEDMGGQNRLMFSPRHIRRFLLPGMKRIIDLAHQAGAYAFHHNDGNITGILPDMVAAGIDLLNPIQWRADGMDRAALKQEYGDRLVLHGAVDNQYTLPFGSVAEVRQEVLDNIRILGKGGGYILAPCHNLQPITPPEHVVVMYQTAYEHGWY